MKKLVERIFIYLLKKMNVPLLGHAHIQMGISAFQSFHISGEEQTLKFIKKHHLIKGMNLVDVGTNNGEYSSLLANIFPDANIYAFEPMNDVFNEAQNALKDLKNVQLFNKGMFSSAGNITLYNNSDHHNNTITTSYKSGLLDFYHAKNLREFTIEVDTLDHFCEAHQLETIDFLKIDVEGAELEVLKGAKNLIGNGKINMVQFEFNDFNVSSRTFMKDFYECLTDFNFYRISSQGLYYLGNYSTSHEIFVFQNILAIHHSKDQFKKHIKF